MPGPREGRAGMGVPAVEDLACERDVGVENARDVALTLGGRREAGLAGEPGEGAEDVPARALGGEVELRREAGPPGAEGEP